MKLIKQSIFSISLIVLSLKGNAQEVITEIPFTDVAVISEKAIVYPVFNEFSKNLNLFFTEGAKLSCGQYNKAFKENSYTTFEYINGNEYKVIDYFSYNDTIEFIYADKSKTNFDKIVYNQKSFEWSLEQDYSLEAGYEYLVSFDYNKAYYLFSVKKGTSIIGLHIFINGELTLINEFDYSKTKFDASGKNLYALLSKKTDKNNKVKKINNNYPGGILTASSSNKAYQDGVNVKITIDNVNDKTTTILNFNLDEFSSFTKIYPMKSIRCLADTTVYENKSNSFISGNILAQLNVCENQFLLSFLDLNTDSILNEYIAKNDDVIEFKYQDNVLNHTGTNSLSVELIRSKMLLRKMAQKEFVTGITMYRNANQLYTIIGAVSLEINNKNGRKGGGKGNGSGGGNGGGNKNGTSNVSGTSTGKGGGNGTGGGNGGNNKAKANDMKGVKIKGSDELVNFDDYSRKKATYMKGVFDFKRAIQLIPKNKNIAFDKIKTYKLQNFQTTPLAETIYYVSDGFVYGYFNPDTKKYVLLKFVD